MTTTGPLPIVATFDDIIRSAKRAFLDTQREMARVARERIDGDAAKLAIKEEHQAEKAKAK